MIVGSHGRPPLATIAVGVDGSPAADSALAWAADETLRRDGELVIVHSWNHHVHPTAPYAAVHAFDDTGRQAGRALIERSVAMVRERFPGMVVRTVLSGHRPEQALIKAAGTAELLVLGSAAHQPGDGRLGAVLLACLRWPPCPVVVVQNSRRPALVASGQVRGEGLHEPGGERRFEGPLTG